MWKHFIDLLQEQKIASISVLQALGTFFGNMFNIISMPSAIQFISATVGIIGGSLLARKAHYDTKKTKLEIEKLLASMEE